MLHMKQFYRSRSRSDLYDRSNILGTSILHLLEYLDGLPDDPTTLSVVILPSYATWSKRSTFQDESTAATRLGRRQRTLENAPVRPSEEDDDFEKEDQELDEEQMNRVHSYCQEILA